MRCKSAVCHRSVNPSPSIRSPPLRKAHSATQDCRLFTQPNEQLAIRKIHAPGLAPCRTTATGLKSTNLSDFPPRRDRARRTANTSKRFACSRAALVFIVNVRLKKTALKKPRLMRNPYHARSAPRGDIRAPSLGSIETWHTVEPFPRPWEAVQIGPSVTILDS